jgi:hypothetical protein
MMNWKVCGRKRSCRNSGQYPEENHEKRNTDTIRFQANTSCTVCVEEVTQLSFLSATVLILFLPSIAYSYKTEAKVDCFVQ